MSEEYILDTSLKLLAGQPIEVEGFGGVEALKVKDIIKYGYSKYMEALNIITLTKDSLLNTVLSDVEENEISGISDLELVIYMSTDEVVELLEEAYKLFFRCEEAFIDKEDFCVFVKYGEDDFKVINKDNHKEIIKIIKFQNYITNLDDEDSSDNSNEDEATKRFKARLKELQAERDKAKSKRDGKDGDSDKITFYDILSSVSTKSNVNDFEVMDLTVYQIYTKFKRLEMISQYDLNIQSILAGAKDIKLKHWSTKIE